MNHRNPDPHEVEPVKAELTRRRFLTRVGLGVIGVTSALPGLPRKVHARAPESGSPPVALLERSPFVYISPILGNGKESRCHAELWYAWIDDSIIVTVAKDRWKAAALRRGLDTARVWVGDHGRWKTMFGGRNEEFLSAPNFIAKVDRVQDAEMIERLLAIYEQKYPLEIATWRDKMRSGNADGSRILLRYRLHPSKNS